MTAEELLERYAAGERDFSSADLRGADLSGSILPAPTMMLLARWENVSDRLCGQLMRYDASNCPSGNKLFSSWAKGGKCPYNKLRIQRCANFEEKLDLWRPGKALSAYRLMVALIREKCRDSDYHRKAKK